MTGTETTKRFPFINLEKSLARAQQMYAADPRNNEMSTAALFELWGYSGKSSGGFQTVGALRSYGMLSGSEGGKVKLSRAMWDYFRDEREDVKAEALKGFALTPPMLRSLWNAWDGTPPADTLARSHLKLELGLNEQSARSVLSIYKDNLAFANLKGGDTIPEQNGGGETKGDVAPKTPPTQVKVGDYVQWTSQGVDQFKPLRQVREVRDEHVFVHGHPGGIPMDQVAVHEAPRPAPKVVANSTHSADNPAAKGDISVYQVGDRLQITADVDLGSLQTLKEMLGHYETILKLLAPKQ